MFHLIGLLFLALAGLFAVITFIRILSYRVVVPTNAVHIVQSSKARTSYGGVDAQGQPRRNTYYAWPAWIPFIGVRVSELPLSVFDLPLDDYNAYDKGRLPFVIDMMAFFRINDSGMAAERVSSFDDLKAQLEFILKGAARTILATSEIQEIMESRAVFGEKFTQEVEHQLTQWGVVPVKNIELMDLRDAQGSQVILNIMAKKKSEIEMESRTTVAANQQAAMTAEINAKREVNLRDQEAQETVGIRTAMQKQKVGISQQQAEQAIQEEAKNTAEKTMAVQLVNTVRAAEINKQAQVVQAEQTKQTVIIRAEGEKQQIILDAEAAQQQKIIVAEGTKQETIAIAEGNLQTSLLAAQGTRAKGEAEGAAETARLMAPVTTQAELASKIGANPAYQAYMVNIRQVEANQAIGVANAGALTKADVKIIVTAGNPVEGARSVLDLFTPKGAQMIGAAVESLRNTSETVNDAILTVGDKINGTTTPHN